VGRRTHSRQTGRVILLDYVPDELLPGLYAGAAAVVYPSWYEGFGLPVLEALAAGVPVVASDVPALREVAGDAPPASVDALADAIQRSLEPDQQSAAERGRRRQRAKRYSWDDAGRTLAVVLAGVAGRPDILAEESSAR
jgi:O-antigen biosynthesis alpha-1,3-mannosyltransferase